MVIDPAAIIVPVHPLVQSFGFHGLRRRHFSLLAKKKETVSRRE